MSFSENMDPQWVREVQHERRIILASKRDPLKLLTDLFELYQEDFDVTNLQKTLPDLYQILQQFCSNIPENYEQLRERSGDLARFFNAHNAEIRKYDIDLYYGILNFIDMLKIKRIYFSLLN